MQDGRVDAAAPLTPIPRCCTASRSSTPLNSQLRAQRAKPPKREATHPLACFRQHVASFVVEIHALRQYGLLPGDAMGDLQGVGMGGRTARVTGWKAGKEHADRGRSARAGQRRHLPGDAVGDLVEAMEVRGGCKAASVPTAEVGQAVRTSGTIPGRCARPPVHAHPCPPAHLVVPVALPALGVLKARPVRRHKQRQLLVWRARHGRGGARGSNHPSASPCAPSSQLPAAHRAILPTPSLPASQVAPPAQTHPPRLLSSSQNPAGLRWLRSPR